MSDDAPSVIAPAPVMDTPSSGDSPTRGSTPASSSRPPSSRTSVEDLTVMSSVEGLGPEQMDEDDDPSIPEQQRRSSRSRRYQRGIEAARAEARAQRLGRLEAERTLKEKYGYEPKPAPESNLSGRDRSEHEPRRTPDDSEQEQEPVDDQTQQEQYDDEQAPQHEQLTSEQRNEVVQRFGQEALQEIEAAATAAERARVFAQQQQLPDYHEVLQSVSSDPELFIPNHAIKLIRHSEHGAAIAYALASSVEGMEEIRRLREMNHEQTAKWVGKAEAAYEAGMRRRNAPPPSQQPQRRMATQASRPIQPLKGSASSPSQTAAVNAYIKKHYGDRG